MIKAQSLDGLGKLDGRLAAVDNELVQRSRKMQIKKTYTAINPELLYDELRDLVQKHDAILGEAKLETYAVRGGLTHTSRGNLTFKMLDEHDKSEKECLRALIIGAVEGETKMMLDIDEKLFPSEKLAALEEDLSFIFGSYERT